MNLHTRKVLVGMGRTDITIRHFTDVHDGHEGFHSRLFDKFIRIQERDPNSYCIGTGDLIDADRPSLRDRKAIMYAEAERKDALSHEDVKDQDWLDKYVIPKYKRLAPRCLGLLDGDHYKIFRNGTTSTQYICQRAKIPYLGERMAFVGLVFAAKTNSMCRYVILARHGTGGGGSNGADLARLERQNYGFLADLYLGGHTHRQNCTPQILLYPNKTFDRVNSKVVWHVRGGSFLRGFMPNMQTYAERSEYGPLVTGWVEVHIALSRVVSNNNVLRVTNSSAELVAD